MLGLPREIIEEILVHCDPLEVAKVAQTCRALHDVIYNPEDSALWRSLYLAQPLDDPRLCISQQGNQRTNDVDWKSEVQRVMRVRTVVRDIELCRPGELLDVLHVLIEITTHVPPLRSLAVPAELSLNLLWAAIILRGGFLDRAEALPDLSKEEIQLLARLHTYFGITQGDTKTAARVRSRAMVYDMRNYRWDNEFGPFDIRGGVDWVHVQALHHDVTMHLVDLSEDEQFEFAVFPMSLPYTQLTIPRGVDLDKEEDWAGVSGMWMVSFCFCDHRELLLYNASETPDSTLDTTLFEDADFREVYRSLEVKLQMSRTEPNLDCPTRPTIFFVGAMTPPSSSTIAGKVTLRPDGQIQWHFVSGEQGNAIWSSEGVQVGGVRSAYGVLGSWTTIFHEADDPVGPFWLRKVSDFDKDTVRW